jgi:hypothetical protein
MTPGERAYIVSELLALVRMLQASTDGPACEQAVLNTTSDVRSTVFAIRRSRA